MSQIFPCRSALFMPATNGRALSKIRELDADFAIVDLEDAVAGEMKAHGRDAIARAFAQGAFAQRRVVIRVNDPAGAEGRADLELCAGLNVHGVLLPKVESGDALIRAGAQLAQGGAPHDMKLWAMVETPRGVLDAGEIARAGGRLECLVAGTNDLGAALRLPPQDRRTGLTGALGQIVLAARAQGLLALDGVFNNIEDDAGLERECAAGRTLGFDGKSLIHPRQVAVANRIFAPEPAVLERARAIVAAFAAAGSKAAVVKVAGAMAERLDLAEAERVIALAGLIARTDAGVR